MEEMTIRLVSVVECNGTVRARLRSEARDVDMRIWLETKFEAALDTEWRDWAEEAYNRALAALDPA